jgi:DNA-directed RNA polymerase subunit M/transcription elongation factor TFIIS
MKTMLKILYGFLALALGTFVSVTLIKAVVSHDTPHGTEVISESRFPDYVQQLNTYYDSYDNRRSHFHQTRERYLLPMSQQENCLNCHSIWPHKKDLRTRAFNNQHSRYMSCMGCHIDEMPGRPIKFEWFDFGVDNSITRQGPFGLTRDAKAQLSGDENFISKIIPVIYDGNIQSRVFTPYSTEQMIEYRKAVDAGSLVDEIQVRKEAEALVGEKALTCSKCHSESSSFPWETLGFTGERLNEMRHSAVVGMVEKYESFYFPPVFE